jgi:hypothetical protein
VVIVAGLVAAGVLLWLFAGGDDDEPGGSPEVSAPPAREGEKAPREEPRERVRERRCEPSPGELEVAVQDNAVLLHLHYGDRDAALRQLVELGASWVKASVLWAYEVPGTRSRSAPAAVTYNFSEHDSLLAAAEPLGLCVELALMGPAPAWATGDGKVGVRDPDPERFAHFARAAAEHFRGRVTRYSIWNEPNHVSWISPLGSAPAIYRRLYEAGYGAIKEVDPGAEVLIGETAGYALPGRSTAPLEFLRELTCRDRAYQPLAECEPLEADGYAHHPYDFDHPPDHRYPGPDNVTIGTLDRLTTALDRLADEGALVTPDGEPVPLYLTEFGYFATGDRRTPSALRAAWLPQAFEIARRNRRVRQMLHYLLLQLPRDYQNQKFNTGIVSQNGHPGPAYRALEEWTAHARDRGQIAAPDRP